MLVNSSWPAIPFISCYWIGIRKAIEEDAAPVFVPEQGAPGDEETQLAHERKRQRQKNDNCDKDCVSQHGNSRSAADHFDTKKRRGRRRRGAAPPKGSRPLERLLILGRPGIELVVGRGLFGAVELQDRGRTTKVCCSATSGLTWTKEYWPQ